MDDRTLWAVQLAKELAPLTAHYQTLRSLAEETISDEQADEVDPSDARTAATACAALFLNHLTVALKKLPELREVVLDGPLPEFLAGMEDLRNGNVPSLFKPTSSVTGRLSTKQEMLKLRTAASVFVLRECGVPDAEARRLVAKIFSDAGHKGKKGGPISPSTIFSWCIDCAPDPNGTSQQRLMAGMIADMTAGRNNDLPKGFDRTQATKIIRREAAKRL